MCVCGSAEANSKQEKKGGKETQSNVNLQRASFADEDKEDKYRQWQHRHEDCHKHSAARVLRQDDTQHKASYPGKVLLDGWHAPKHRQRAKNT